MCLWTVTTAINQGGQGRGGALTSAPRPAPRGEISAPRSAPPRALGRQGLPQAA